MLSETSLSDDFYDAEIGCYNYNIFRCDRDVEITGKKSGGGVLIAVSKRLCALKLDIISHTNRKFEELWILVTTDSRRLLLCVVYIPPRSPVECYHDHCSAVEEMASLYDSEQILIVGDYNLPGSTWQVDEDLGYIREQQSKQTECVLETMFYCNLCQLNNIHNANMVLLDLVLTNNSNATVSCADTVLSRLDTHHPALCISFSTVDNFKPIEYENSICDFRNCDYDAINNFLINVPWDNIFNCDVNDAIVTFYNILDVCLSVYVPKIIVKSNYKFPPWFSEELKHNIFKKKEAHRQYKISGTIDCYEAFSCLRSLCKAQAQQCYEQYIGDVEQSISGNPKYFWNYIRGKNRDQGLPNTMRYVDTISSDVSEIANLFADHFASVYVKGSSPTLRLDFDTLPFAHSNISIGNFYVEISSVLDRLSGIDLNKGPGPDGLTAFFLKNCALPLSRPLWLIFNLSLSTGVFPKQWKHSYIKPIFKNCGKRDLIENYRPITLMSLIPKLFESIIADFLRATYRNFISVNQHGFCVNRSTTSNLLVYHDYIVGALEKGYPVDSVYTDFSKAFDRVDHGILLEKLYIAGIHGTFLQWIYSYLSDREQVVKLNNYYSRIINVTSGVPQGAHLAPLLFNLFVNDVSECFTFSQFILYADDLKIYLSLNDADYHNKLQHDLDQFYNWCCVNKLQLNIKKCNYIRFSRSTCPLPHTYFFDGKPINRVDIVRDLGVLFDSKLTFSQHISACCSKALRMLGFVKRNTRDFKNIFTIRVLYLTLVRPHLEGSTIIWSPYFNIYIDKLESVQRKFLRYIAFKGGIPSDLVDYGALQRDLNIDSLNLRRERADIIMAHKILHGSVDCPYILSQLDLYVPPRPLRENITFYVQLHRTNYGQNVAVNRIMKHANEIDLDLFHLSEGSLRRYLRHTYKCNM